MHLIETCADALSVAALMLMGCSDDPLPGPNSSPDRDDAIDGSATDDQPSFTYFQAPAEVVRDPSSEVGYAPIFWNAKNVKHCRLEREEPYLGISYLDVPLVPGQPRKNVLGQDLGNWHKKRLR